MYVEGVLNKLERFTVFGQALTDGKGHGFNSPVSITPFADGSCKVSISNITSIMNMNCRKYVIRAFPRNMDDIMVIGQIVDVIKRASLTFIESITLDLRTTLFSRYDRVMHSDRSDAFGLKVFINVLASFGITHIRTLDAHSEVFGLLVEDSGMTHKNTTVVEALIETLNGGGNFEGYSISQLKNDFIIVAPDKGLKSKIESFADITCDKVRKAETGRILGVEVSDWGRLENVNSVNKSGKSLLIIDDICERGGTFFGVAKALREAGVTAPISLCVTHGIMPEGTDFAKMAETFDNVFVNTMHVSRVYEAEQQIKGTGGSFFCKNIYK